LRGGKNRRIGGNMKKGGVIKRLREAIGTPNPYREKGGAEEQSLWGGALKEEKG